MKYCISIDWLAIFCDIPTGSFSAAQKPAWEYRRNWAVKRESYGTRQFSEFHRVALGDEDFCEIQSAPYSSIMKNTACIVRVVNRQLYQPQMWYDLQCFFEEFGIIPKALSRCDLCADFNRFECYECVPFIRDFLNSTIRHKGRGKGAAYFDHFSKVVGKNSISTVKYTGLSFGSNESDCRVYLYNKTFELQSVKDKPYIRDLWVAAGLNVTIPVWRLEVSLKSKARNFKDKQTGERKEITPDDLKDTNEVAKLYHTFVRKYFAFVKNRPNITNISREPTLQLFGLQGAYIHAVLRNVSGGDRMERILIKQLWQMSDRYRTNEDYMQDEGITKGLAIALAKSTDLADWLKNKSGEWTKPHKK